MSLNQTPKANRIHIALFGKTNAGKSSIINAITNQDIALVSDVKGTTTDPVYKAIEILPLGPCVVIDTAGLDDDTKLGKLRIKKSLQVLNKADIAIVVVDASIGITKTELDIIEKVKVKKLPIMVLLNKMDLVDENSINIGDISEQLGIKPIKVSAMTNKGIDDVKEALGKLVDVKEDKFRLVGDLVEPGDFVVLVTPIDKAAPKGRLILPQQQTIRDLLESDAIAIVTKEYELRETLENLGKKPKLVITDSQAFLKVSADTPKDIMLTSFSILFARLKSDLLTLVEGIKNVEKLNDGDKVLILEGCTHHRQSDDIGTVKIPRWLREYTGKELHFEFKSGHSFPENVNDYKLVVMCGSCMLNNKEVISRMEAINEKGVPVVNYGLLIAYVKGILPRALEPFPLAMKLYEES